MIGLRIAPLAGAAPQPWRNGGGVTRELLAWPAGDGPDWSLRVSLAQIDHDGPFSVLAGIERWCAVVAGAGVALQLDGRRHELTPHSQPLCFDGGAAPACTLLAGPTTDLNLMLRRSAGHGRLQRAPAGGDWHSPAAWRALYAGGPGRLLVDGKPVAELAAEALAWHPHAAGQHWSFRASAADTPAWFMCFQPHGPRP